MENGKPVAVHGIARNVNKRLQAEKNMLIFSKAFNLATDGIDISDSDHKISFINESGAKLFGYSRRELLGQPANISYAEEDLPNLEENVIPAMEKYGYWNGLILGRKKDGSVIPIEVSLSSVMDQIGKPLVNIGVFREFKSNL
ncbi:MAG: PAS domain S-box protein [Methanosarcinales archaeon]|nr:PAS domain S-box protein [Methanosarcinales archaeon]